MDNNSPIMLRICDVDWYVLKELAGVKYIVVAKDVLFKGYYALTPPPTFNDSKLYNFLNKKFVSNFDDWDIDRTKISPITVPTLGQYNMYIRNKLPPCTLPYLLSTVFEDKLDTLTAVMPSGDIVGVYMTEQCGIRPCFIIEKDYAQQFVVSANAPQQIEDDSIQPDEQTIAKIIESANKAASHQNTDTEQDIDISEQIIIAEEGGIADVAEDEQEEIPDVDAAEADEVTENEAEAEVAADDLPPVILAHPHSGAAQTETEPTTLQDTDVDEEVNVAQTEPSDGAINDDGSPAEDEQDTQDDNVLDEQDPLDVRERDEQDTPDNAPVTAENAPTVEDTTDDAPSVISENVPKMTWVNTHCEEDAEPNTTEGDTCADTAAAADDEPIANGFFDEIEDDEPDRTEQGSDSGEDSNDNTPPVLCDAQTEPVEQTAPDTEVSGVFDDEIDDEMPCTVDTHEPETVEAVPEDLSDDLFAGATTEAGHFYNTDYDDDKDASGLLEDSPVERDFASVELDKELNEDPESDITISYASPQPVVYMYSDEFKDYGLVIRNQAQLDEILRQHGLVIQKYNSVGRIERKPVSKSSITDRIMSVQKRWNHKK